MKKSLMSLFFAAQVFSTTFLSAQDTDAAPARDQGMWQTIVMIGIAILFFYFILWRPEQKRRKALEGQREGLKKGDRVTAMGILGTVDRLQEHSVILKMYDGSKIEFLKGAITEVAPNKEVETAGKPEPEPAEKKE